MAAFDVYINYIKDPKDPDLVGMKFMKANIYRRYNHYDEAIPIFLEILDKHPTHETALFSANSLLDYYILHEDRSRYADYSGCGNTLKANHPIVRRLIVDSLKYWVESMHVDGFRFDLGAGNDSSCTHTPMDDGACAGSQVSRLRISIVTAGGEHQSTWEYNTALSWWIPPTIRLNKLNRYRLSATAW